MGLEVKSSPRTAAATCQPGTISPMNACVCTHPSAAAAGASWWSRGAGRPRWSEVTPGLWVGGRQRRRSPTDPNLDRFALVVSLDQNTADEEQTAGEEWQRFFPDGQLPSWLPELAAEIAIRHRDGDRILIRCREGINRSALVAGLTLLELQPATGCAVVAQLRGRRHPHILARRAYAQHLCDRTRQER